MHHSAIQIISVFLRFWIRTFRIHNEILTIPSSLAVFSPLLEASANITRSLTFTSTGGMGNLAGPFVINGATFDMATINYTVPLNNIEIWSLTNQTPIAHPFHIHDVQFFILDINGTPPPPSLQGLHDVVLVPGGMGTVRFIAQFNDHSNDSIPYMYHCHMLTHEDMGMMGQFLVVGNDVGIAEETIANWSLYPNPTSGEITISADEPLELEIYSANGKLVRKIDLLEISKIDFQLVPGVYFVSDSKGASRKLVVN